MFCCRRLQQEQTEDKSKTEDENDEETESIVEARLNEKLLLELECPICSSYMTPPIAQCPTGHSICNPCRTKLYKCGFCQKPYNNTRNFALENVASKVQYPCANKPYGCPYLMPHIELEEHLKQCTFRGYKCEMENCLWIGKLEDLEEHWTTKSSSPECYNEANECKLNLDACTSKVNLVKAHDRLFWFKFRYVNRKLYWVVQYIGVPTAAEGYSYEIEIVKVGTKMRTLMCNSCQDIDVKDLYSDDISVSISSIEASKFTNEETILTYFLRVNKEKESTKPNTTNSDAENEPTPPLTSEEIKK